VGASDPSGIKWDSNKQTAGILGIEVDSQDKFFGFAVSDDYKANYNTLWASYGSKTLSPKNPFVGSSGDWTITAAGAQAYETMNRAAK
jgi:hypothetical protein